MKILRSFIAFVAMAGIVSVTSCSDDWGKSDPTPGTDVYPVKEVVGTYNFEYADDVEALSDMSAKGDRISKHENVILEVVNDEALGSNVLHLDSGYVRMVNPFVGSKGLQNGAAITMWVKTDSVTLHSALFAFGDETLAEENISERFFFSENSWLSYTKPNQLETLNLDENNPEDNKTSAMTNDKSWHFVALQLKSDGYVFYVDGEKKAQQDVKAERTTQFSYSNLLTYLETAPYLYIGAGNDSILAETWIDDITIYRNMMDVKDWNKKMSGSDEEKQFEYIIGEPIKAIGAPDCSTGWWSQFSNYFRLPSDSQLKLHFINHTSGGANWNNWNLCLSTDDDRGGASYKEYAVVRSDLYGWGETYATGVWSNEGYPANDDEWAEFRQNMEGADVVVTVTRSKGKATIDAVATCKNGKIYHEWITVDCGDDADPIRAFLIVDSSYLEMQDVFVNQNAPVTISNIGASDCSTGWWTSFSDYFVIPGNCELTLNFINHTSGGANWNNWNLCLSTDDDRGGASYKEYAVVRSDLYGWGETYATGVWSNEGYPANDDEWAEFRQNMEGANVTIRVTRSDGKVKIDAVATCKNGKIYHEWITVDCGDDADPIRAFLIVDASYLEMNASACTIGKKVM